MSRFFRTRDLLTIEELAGAWAREVDEDERRFKAQLTIAAGEGMFDVLGPDGEPDRERHGLWIKQPNEPPRPAISRLVPWFADALDEPGLSREELWSSVHQEFLLTRSAAERFAQEWGLRPPSFWSSEEPGRRSGEPASTQPGSGHTRRLVRPESPALSFGDISRAWAPELGVSPDAVLELLVAGFWRGEFEVPGMGDPQLAIHPPDAYPSDLKAVADVDGYLIPRGKPSLTRCTRRVALVHLFSPFMALGSIRTGPEPLGDFDTMEFWTDLDRKVRTDGRADVDDIEANWERLASLPLDAYDETTRLFRLQQITVQRHDFAQWCRGTEFTLPRFWFPASYEPPPGAGRKPEVLSRRLAILAAFDRDCEEGRVSFKRGGLTRTVERLQARFPEYKVDSIRRIIQIDYKERQRRHQSHG